MINKSQEKNVKNLSKDSDMKIKASSKPKPKNESDFPKKCSDTVRSDKRKSKIGDSGESVRKKIRSLENSNISSSELMNKLEKFSDVWNDIPSVENSKQISNRFERDYHSPSSKDFKYNSKTFQIHYSKNYNNESEHKHSEIKENKINKSRKLEKDVLGNEPLYKKTDESKLKLLKPSSKPTTDILSNNNQDYPQNLSNLADFKRKKAVEGQRQIHVDQKKIIKQALSALDGKQLNKKIVFSNDDDIGKGSLQEINEGNDSKDRHQLFGNDDSDPETDLKINRQFEGKKGQKLLELQTKFASDSRFALDTRFCESDSDEDEEESSRNSNHANEKEKQLAILESIVKRQIKPLSEIKKKSSNKTEDLFMVRFDPTREDHKKYILNQEKSEDDQKEKVEGKKKKKKQKIDSLTEADKIIEENNVESNKTLVSKEKYYSVKEDLKEVLKTESKQEFSLLKLFGPKGTDNLNENSEQSQSVKKNLRHKETNPFKYDSSESEEEDEKSKTIQQPAVSWRTTFFLADNDTRLNEAWEFLKGPEEKEDKEQYTEKRKMLKNFIRKKIKNNTNKKGLFKKKLGGLKKKDFKNTKRRVRKM